MHASKSTGSESSQLVDGVPPVSGRPEGSGGTGRCQELIWLDHVDDKPRPNLLQEEEEEVESPPSSPECLGGADSDDYSMTSESGEGHRCRRCQRAERRLAPARLNLPIFHSTDVNADVTYEIWCF